MSGSSQQRQQRRLSSQPSTAMAAQTTEKSKRDTINDNEGEEDDEVIPSWPSKQEQMLARNASSEIIQHKVYSLKDYSQVASPTAISSSTTSTFQQPTSGGAAGKLLKSMSQDRKVKSSKKRMSECIYPASQMSASQSLFSPAAGSKTALSPPVSLIAGGQTNSASFSVGQASSINSLMPAVGRAGNAPNLIAGESRIDRMRKLFVSPLSLRSSASGNSTSSSAATTMALSGGTSTDSTTIVGSDLKQRGPRLSLQVSTSSGAGKPTTAAHHLMHAMHRTAGPTTAAAGLAQAMVVHRSRRSPMRQKQGKGFRVYGCPLQMANNIYPITCFGRADIYKLQSVPYVLARLCNYIEENSSQLTHEGIFRVSGNARLMEKLRTLFDHLGDAPLESESVDVATSASMLKMYLRELPEPLIPTRMNYYFITLAKKYAPYLSREQASSTSHALQQQQKHNQQKKQQASAVAGGSSNSTTSISTGPDEIGASNSGQNNSQYVRQRLAFSRDLTKLIRKLPIENYNLLKYLACFLYRISLKQQFNKMCAEALGIVFGPNVFRIRSESYKGLKEQELSNQIMASIISNYKLIFDSELTDPLGNVLDGNENNLIAAAVTKKEAIEHQNEPMIPIDTVPIETTSTGFDLLAQAERLAQRADFIQSKMIPIVPVVPIDPNATASNCDRPQPVEKLEDAHDSCCPGRCKDYLYDHKARQTPRSGQAEIDDYNDDDCDDDNGEESYTPSSGSDSYCSSMDSQTLESSYEGDGEIDGRKASRLAGDLTSRSTSECGSDTSYTPTSSHTDSYVQDDDDDDEEDEDEDEDKETPSQELSSPLNNAPQENKSGGTRADCKVCKRRESLHITNLASIREPTQASKPENETSKPDVNSKSSSVPEMSPGDTQAGHHTMPHHKRARALLNDGECSSNAAPTAVAWPSSRRSKASGTRRRQQDHHHNWDSRRQSRHSMRARNSRQAAMGTLRSANEEPAAHTMVVACDTSLPEDTESMPLGAWSEIFTRHLAEEAACAAANYEEPDSPARYFLMRSFNSDETLLRSLNYCYDWPHNNQSNIDDASTGALATSEGQQRQPVISQRRRHSNLDFIKDTPMGSLLPMVCRPCEQIFEALDLAEEVELPTPAGGESDEPKERQQPQKLRGKLGEKLAAREFIETSTISLIDNKIGFRRSELSMNNLDEQNNFSQSCHGGGGFGSGGDAILVQMVATKDLIKILKKLSRLGRSRGFTKEIEQMLLKFANSEGGGNSVSQSIVSKANRVESVLLAAYSDDCLACYVDHLSARGFMAELAAALDDNVQTLESDNLVAADDERLCKILSVKITLFKQRYNDLKNIRAHYLRHHINGALMSALDSLPARYNHRNRGDVGEAHGSLDTLKMQAQQVAATDTMTGHRSRILSVPNRELLSHSSNTSENRSRSATASKEPDSRDVSGNEETLEAGTTKSASISGTGSECKFGPLCPVEFLFNIEKQLALKRILGEREIKLNQMTPEQLQSEKLELQKNLLRYEHWFGRPVTRFEFSLVGHLYERYRAVKVIKRRKQQPNVLQA